MQSLINKLAQESPFFCSEIHGFKHWQQVEKYALHIAQFNQANKQVLSLFAYLHDCKRENESIDPNHGIRAAEYAYSLYKQKSINQYMQIETDEFDLLYYALKWHNHDTVSQDETISTCWDADRLELPRVGININPAYLTNQTAKEIANQSQTSFFDFR